MSSDNRVTTIRGASALVLASLLLASAAPAYAQGLAKESIPGGVEAKPSISGAPRPDMAPAPAAPAVTMESAKPSSGEVARPKPQPEPLAKPPKKSKKATPPAAGALMRSAPVQPSPVPGLPVPGGDESKPGAVERVQPGPAVQPR